MSEPLSCVISSQDHHLHLIQEDPLSPRRVEKGLKQGGVTVVIGAGAMGRMHVDLAFSYHPRAIVVADLLPERLQLVEKHFSRRARESRIELVTINTETDSLRELVGQISDDQGADDVIVAAGSRSAIESAQCLVGRRGNLNLFGGLKKGEDVVDFDTGIVHYREIVITGSSGGSPWDVRRTLELMATSQINPDSHISDVGDLEHAAGFLEKVKAQQLSGKALVYPHRRIDQTLTVERWSDQDERDYLRESGS
jgi:L-iditol 2-dehydrogenase